MNNTENKTTLNADNKSKVFSVSTNSTIDGFTITGGYNNSDNGGGLLISGGNPTITNCTISGNNAGKGGGGLYIGASGNPTITNCTISGNTAGYSGNGGGLLISGGTPTITNCTITGNRATSNNNYGGGLYIDGGTPTITNCAIVNNTAPNGNEIYRSSGTVNLRNTLVWNTDTANAINGTTTYSYCAYPAATGDNNIALSAWESPVSSDVKVNGVTHKVYKILNNYNALQSIIAKGNHDVAPTYDQIGNAFANPPSIGALEYVLPVLSVDITGESSISTSYGTAKTETFTPIVSLDNEALTTDYTVSWDVAVSPDISEISIDQSGELTVGSATPVGTYEATVKAQATYGTITSKVAEKIVAITVESGDMTLTLTSTNLPNGKVNTAYTEAQYFTATATPSSADLAWEVEGLPAGLSFNEGKISGTPTEAGNFSVKVTVTATLANYTTTSENTTVPIKIEAADEQSGGSGDGTGGSDDSATISTTESGISSLTPTQKQTVKTLILTGIDDLSQITADFSNLKTIKISSDAVVNNNGALDLSSLPASVENFLISDNTSLTSLNLKECKVSNIDASGCAELTSVDVSGNTSIVTLDVSKTNIKLLDASKCSNLTSVDCSNCLLSELNVEACNALKSINCSHNSLLVLDIPLGLANLASVDCTSQEIINWHSVVSFNFDEFVQSHDNVFSTSSLVSVSATKLSNVSNLKAYDAGNNEIAVTSDDNGNITFESVPEKLTYDYDIGFNDQVMDVTVYSAGSSYSTNIFGSSGGGCNVMGNLAIILLFSGLALLKLKIKKM